MISRILSKLVTNRFFKGKAIVIMGPRQTGKTTLLENAISQFQPILFINCDDPFDKSQIEGASLAKLRQIIGNRKVVFIDEAQRVKNIGVTLKLITDQIKDVQLIVSGSSSLDLASEINEPLTGRKWEYLLLPISWKELSDDIGYLASMQQLEQRIIFGMYPDVINQVGLENDVLKQITNSYLYRDLLSYNGIRKPEFLHKLLQALAFQVGNQVSYNELSNMLQIDKVTIANYIDLLEKAFVIFKVQPFARNLRNEITSSRKIYFYDTGIRNCIINNFNSFEYRTDVGVLWENFVIAERMKALNYAQQYTNLYFWRTHQQQEIDLIEERNGTIEAFEFKWKSSPKIKVPSGFKNGYPDVKFSVIDKDNFFEFVDIESQVVYK